MSELYDLSDSDSEWEDPPPECKVAGLYSIADLERECRRENLRFTKETNSYLLYETLKTLGPLQSQKLLQKCE